MNSELNRRGFLELATAGLGAACLAAAATRAPEIPLVKMNAKVLVAYATRCGSTQEVAQAVAQDLKGRGYAAEVRPADKVSGLSGYDAVVLGSAVRFGRWLPEASKFVRSRQAELKRVPTVFFSVHGQNTGADEASRKARHGYIDPERALVQPAAEAYFAGKLDSSRLSFGPRMLIKMMGAKDRDMRDWPAIHAWAQSIFRA